MLYCQQMKQHLRAVLAIGILVATAVAFGYYIKRHPQTLDQLRQVPPVIILALIILYAVAFMAYVLVTRASLHVYGKTMTVQENILFNAYSALINFFGPAQSGPIFRAAYLKKRHGLYIKKFMLTMLVYMGFLAIISAMFMVVGSRPWWQTLIAMVLVGAACFMVIKRYRQRSAINAGSGFNPINIGWIFGATLVQVTTLAVIYGIELRQIGSNASVGQILSYTGVSNFSLFVALTPGAIGIREVGRR